MHTALYRKKRPQTFKDVIGQESIITTLQNQLRSNTVSHAYLLCGTRGTGKTTSAKIFARAVNCPYSAELGDPCNTCEACTDILAERSLNVIEIDAASNNGVDNIRDLREEVKYPPSFGRYKVYIIDEVHMLTTAAFNALLKTLEEPPEHVIFVLATTDPQKIPATILSRCQRYDFKRINRYDMCQTLSDYMDKEGIKVEAAALEYIASASDGAMRDALSILDQCISLYENEDITLDKIQGLLGAVNQGVLFAYTDALLQKNASAALHIISQVSKDGRDLTRFTSDIISHMRNILIAAQINDYQDILDYSSETVEKFKLQGNTTPPETLIEYIKEFSELQNQLRYSSQERLMLEVFTVKLSALNSTGAPVAQVPVVNSQVKPVKVDILKEEPAAPLINTVEVAENIITEPEAQIPKSSESNDISSNWAEFCSSLSGLLKSMLALCKVESGEGIKIICNNIGSKQYITDHKDSVAEALVNYFKLPSKPNIVIVADEEYNKPIEQNANMFKDNIQSQINMPVSFE